MTALSSSQLQNRYREQKLKLGWKRVQIWKLDEKDKNVRQRVQQGTSIANSSQDEQHLVDDITKYSDKLLKDIPL